MITQKFLEYEFINQKLPSFFSHHFAHLMQQTESAHKGISQKIAKVMNHHISQLHMPIWGLVSCGAGIGLLTAGGIIAAHQFYKSSVRLAQIKSAF